MDLDFSDQSSVLLILFIIAGSLPWAKDKAKTQEWEYCSDNKAH